MTTTAETDTRDEADLEKVTELEAFGPERLDGVNGPANGFAPLMLKSITSPAEPEFAATLQEGHIATVTEPASQDTAAQAEASPPAPVTKASEDTVTVEIPKGASISISPADLAKLNTLKRQLVLEHNSGEGQAVKRDMDLDVGGGVDRDKLKDSDFVFPDTRDFPIVTPADVSDAVSSWGRYKGSESFDAFKSKLTALANRKGPKFTAELPKSWTKPGAKKAGAKDCPGCGKTYHADSKQRTCENCGHDLPRADENDTAKAKAAKPKTGDGKGKGKKKPWKGEPPFKGAAPPYKEGNSGHDAPKPGPAKDKTKKAAKAFPADAKVDAAIGRLKTDADAALAAQHADPDAETHPADRVVTETLEHVKDDVAAAAAAQAKDEETDSAAEHAAKSIAGEAPAYHLARLHDATCAAYHAEDVNAVHPLAAKGLAALADPAPFAAMVTSALAEDAGTGSRAADLPNLSAAYHAAVAFKAAAAHDGLLEEAMDGLRKAFAEMYPDARPKPGAVTPGQFHRPYLATGRATQAAKPGQAPRVPLSSHVPDPDDFKRPLLTSGREAASPGSSPAGLGKARMYYSNAGKQDAATVLAAMHDWIADNHPTICPMTGAPYDNEPGVDVNSMGSTLTTAQPMPSRMTATGAANSPLPVGAARAASIVTPGPTRKNKADKAAAKEERKMAKAARIAQEAAAAAIAAHTPAIDPELLKSTLRDILAEELGDLKTTLGEHEQRIAEWESAPDPAQMAPRNGAAALGKARDAGQEVPAGGDGPSEQRLMRLMKKTLDPDGGVRVEAIGELTELVGREKAAELLAAAH